MMAGPWDGRRSHPTASLSCSSVRQLVFEGRLYVTVRPGSKGRSEILRIPARRQEDDIRIAARLCVSRFFYLQRRVRRVARVCRRAEGECTTLRLRIP